LNIKFLDTDWTNVIQYRKTYNQALVTDVYLSDILSLDSNA
jgi:hypothetical protein